MRLQAKALLVASMLWIGVTGRSQEVAHTATPTVIRTDSKLVLVDAIVTDKKGNYIADLTQKDFKVYEDNKEQALTSFSFEGAAAQPNNKKYLAILFDNASVAPADQVKARTAAQQFVDKNLGENKFIAVANFSGRLKITQNFTNDADQLKAAIAGIQNSALTTNDSAQGINGINGTMAGRGLGGRTLGGGAQGVSESSRFGISSLLLGIRGLAKGMADLPGRKMVVMLTSGFVIDDRLRPDVIATIAACNKANVSIYPIDVRGLTSGMETNNPRGVIRDEEEQPQPQPQARLLSPGGRLAGFANSFAPYQARGGTPTAPSTGTSGSAPGGAAGGTPGGTTGGNTGSTPGGARGGNPGIGNTGNPGTFGNTGNINNGAGSSANPNNNGNNPLDPLGTRGIIPDIGNGIEAQREALYMMAQGTGGFVIVNTNDLLGGMDKIARDQTQYYVLGFVPTHLSEGTCHVLKVKVERGGTNLRSRSGYCDVRQVDPLAGKPIETELETLAISQTKGKLASPLQLPFFYSAANIARVNVAMELPGDAFKFEKVKGKFHAEVNLMGVAYKPDNTVGAKFSDTVKFDFDDKKLAEALVKKPVHYESQFDIGTGQYNVKVVFTSGGENFGRIEKPLTIEPFDGKQFAVSALALSAGVRRVGNDLAADAALLDDRVPMIANNIQVIPAALYRFKSSDQVAMYLELFEPAVTNEKPGAPKVSLRIIDLKNGEQKIGSDALALDKYVHTGNPVVPVVLNLPIQNLPSGNYRVDVMGISASGQQTVRSAEFELEAAAAKGPDPGWGKN